MLHRIGLALGVALLCVAPASGAVTPPPASHAATPPSHPAKSDHQPPPLTAAEQLEAWCLIPGKSPAARAGTSKLTAALADNITWQPQDGHVRFTVSYAGNATPSQIDNLEIRVCFGWPQPVQKSADQGRARTPDRATYLRTVSRDDHSVTYETTLPEALWWDNGPDQKAPTFADVWSDFWHRLNGEKRRVYDGWGIVPILNMHIVGAINAGTNVTADPNALDVVLPVGLSFRGVALLVTLVMVGIAWSLLLRWAKHRKVRGGLVLRIISNRYNYASLSQFQIMLWTLVIAAGAIYVMALTGSLISVPAQALALLGISGFSALSAAVKSQQDAAKPQPAADAAPQAAINPSAVRGIQVLKTSQNDAFAAWRVGDGGTPAVSFALTLKDKSGTATAIPAASSGATPDCFIQLSGLDAAKAPYTLSVTAVDAAGNTSGAVSVTVAPQAAAPGALPDLGTLSASLPNNDNTVEIAWTAVNDADAYVVQYRQAGAGVWSTSGLPVAGAQAGAKRSARVAGLAFETPYEFRVAGIKDGRIGVFSNVLSLTTAARMPKWSDLVVWDGIHELDITRVQMLVFTVLAAFFVVLKIGDESAIPQIPDSVILLMGLSNGVYVGGKFIGATK